MPCYLMSSEMGKVRMRVSRRQVLVQAAAIAAGVGAFRTNRLIAADAACSDRVAGLLVGGLIGDAPVGCPVEFADGEKVAGYLLGMRDWPASRTMTADDRDEWAETLPLLSYEKLRPDAVPYGPWRESAEAGTGTDDSRHKIVLVRAIRKSVAQEQATLTAADLVRQYLDFKPIAGVEPDADTQELCEKGFAEYRMAARWLLGDRDEALALPVERLWAGIANCSGQMMLPPLAAAYVGRPEAAYRAAYAIDFIDAPLARDFAAALIAGLAFALSPEHDSAGEMTRWQLLLRSMRETNPYRLNKVPFAGRPLHRWMDMAEDVANRAQRCPAKLFELLETDGRPTYWWDAHDTLLVPLAVSICQFNVAAALHLTLDFGHDTDSYWPSARLSGWSRLWRKRFSETDARCGPASRSDGVR